MDNTENEPTMSKCDKCGGYFIFDNMVIAPPIDDPRLLCSECYKNECTPKYDEDDWREDR